MGVPGHPTKTVTHPLDGPVEIDVRLAPLIRQLWRRGIETSQSCQEYNPGLACIEFPGTAEVMEFLEVAREDYRVELEKWDECAPDCLAVVVRLLVLFPAAGIPKLVARFKSAPAEVMVRPARPPRKRGRPRKGEGEE